MAPVSAPGARPRGSGSREIGAAPFVRVADAPERRVHLQHRQLLVGGVFQREGHGGHELLLAVDDAGVEPAGRDGVHLEAGRQVDVASAGRRRHQAQHHQSQGEHAHVWIDTEPARWFRRRRTTEPE